MARWETLLCAAGLLLSGAGKTDAFYLPGKAPNSFGEGEKVRVLSKHCARQARLGRKTGLVGEHVLLANLIMGHSWVGMPGRCVRSALAPQSQKTD